MEKLSDLKPGDMLGQVDLASYVGAMAKGVAEAQRALDDNTIGLLGAFTKGIDSLAGKSLLQLGLSPAFYHFRSATISASVNMSMRVREEIDVSVHVGGGKSSDSSSTQTATLHQVKNTTEVIHVSESVNATASTSGSIMERLDSYSGANSSTRLIVTERGAVTKAQSFSESGVALYKAGAALFVVPPAGMRWAVLSITAGSAANAMQIAVGSAYPSAAASSALDFAAGLSQQLTNISVAILAPLPDPDGLRVVKFETGSHVVKKIGAADYAARLRALAEIIKAAGIATLTIIGHTDGVGTKAYNQKLSVLRAQAVKDVLTVNGVTATMTVTGHGETEASDNLPDQEARNVTITFDNEPSGYFAFLCEISIGAMQVLTPSQPGPGNLCIGTGLYATSGTVGGATVTTAAEVATTVNGGADAQASQFEELVYLTNRENTLETVARISVFQTQESTTDSTSGQEQDSSTLDSSTLDTFTEKTVNSAAAIAGSIDARFARMFDMSMAGNMSIAAELVSIPAPPEFLQFIKDYLEE